MCINKFFSNLVWKTNRENKKYNYKNLYMSYTIVS